MNDTNIAIVRQAYQAYADHNRAALEAVIADDFHFTSPVDNRIDRATYFARCWPASKTITGFTFIHLISEGPRILVTYEGQRQSGKPFRNTEILTLKNNKIIDVEVYFGWSVPHDAPPGHFLAPNNA